MNSLQRFSKRLVDGQADPPGIGPARVYQPPLAPAEDWLSRLGEVARRLPARGPAAHPGAPDSRTARWARVLARRG